MMQLQERRPRWGLAVCAPPTPPRSCVALLREPGWARLVLAAFSKLLMSWSLTSGFADRLSNASRIM